MPSKPVGSINLFVQDVDKNFEYFTETLGFSEVERFRGPDGQAVHAQVAFGTGEARFGVGLASIPNMLEGPGDYDFAQFGANIRESPQTLGNGVVLYFRVPNVDKYYAKIQANGAIIDEPPTDQDWGDRTISVLTPDGYYMTFYQPIRGWKPPPGAGTLERPTLSKAEKAQRRYAGTMTHVRARAAKTPGGKGRIAKRPAARRARRRSGL